jgi:four helix bundle protein
MTGIRRFEDAKCWQEARVLDRMIHDLTSGAGFRDSALRNQMRKASNSVKANIAEGFERNSDREFVRFLRIAKASLAELQSHLYTALDRRYLTPATFDSLMNQARSTARLTGGFIAYLVRKLHRISEGDAEQEQRKR